MRATRSAAEYRIDGASIGRRALKNMALAYLAAAGAEGIALARAQFDAQRNMTDVLAALAVLARTENTARDAALAAFHARWRGEDLVLDKWFAIQAMAPLPDTLDRVRALTRHPDFDPRSPNRVRALVGAFAAGNPLCFHAASGAGYDFLAEQVIATRSAQQPGRGPDGGPARPLAAAGRRHGRR